MKMRKLGQRIAFFSAAVMGTAVIVQAQTQQQNSPFQQQAQQKKQKRDVIAMVNGDPITKTELKATLQQRLRNQDVDPQQAQKLQKQVLNNLIESRLIEQYVLKEGPKVEQKEVDGVIQRLKQQIESQGVTFDQFLQARGYTEKTMKKRIQGSLGWQKYQQKQLTDENLQAHYEKNKDRFPGKSFDQARQEVTQSFASKLWNDVVQEMRPDAEIKMVKPQSAPLPPNGNPDNSPSIPQQR